MQPELVFLEDYLREEFANYPEVRIRMVLPSGTRRSVDLKQDYDATSQTIHKRTGIIVRTEQSESFFPLEWITQNQRTFLQAEVEKIKIKLS